MRILVCWQASNSCPISKLVNERNSCKESSLRVFLKKKKLVRWRILTIIRLILILIYLIIDIYEHVFEWSEHSLSDQKIRVQISQWWICQEGGEILLRGTVVRCPVIIPSHRFTKTFWRKLDTKNYSRSCKSSWLRGWTYYVCSDTPDNAFFPEAICCL